MVDFIVGRMHEKCRQGVFPGHAPFGYRNNKASRTIEIDPVDSPMVSRLMAAYATGAHTLSTLRKMLKTEFGKKMSKASIDWVLKNRFYIGEFKWGGETYVGTHPLFIDREIFDTVQAVFAGHNRPKYGSQEIAFRGLVNCAYDGCTVTGEIKKGKYVYYRCTGYHGKCDLPRFKEEELAARLGEPLKHLQVPREIVERIVTTLREDQKDAASKMNADRSRLEGRLTTVRNRMDAAYLDKLDGKISEEFWERKMADWRMEEQQVKLALDALANAETQDRALSAERTLELANRAYSLYVSRDSFEKAKLLRMLLSNCSVDALTATPAYRYPFNLIFKRAKMEEWSGRLDSNQRPPAPEAGALPDCATPRTLVNSPESHATKCQRPPAGHPASD